MPEQQQLSGRLGSGLGLVNMGSFAASKDKLPVVSETCITAQAFLFNATRFNETHTSPGFLSNETSIVAQAFTRACLCHHREQDLSLFGPSFVCFEERRCNYGVFHLALIGGRTWLSARRLVSFNEFYA